MLEIGQEWVLYTTPFRLKEVSAAPSGGEIIPDVVALYAKDNGSGVSQLCYKTDAGTEICLPTSGSIVTGTGTANRLVKWLTSTTIGDFAPTAGSVLFAGVGGIGQEDNANFFWDDTNNRLGIGTNTPGVNLHIQPGTPADTRIRLWSGGPSSRSVIEIGRTLADTSLGTTGAALDFSDIVLAAGESVLRATTSHLVLTARSASGKIKFANGAADTEKFEIGASGEWGIGGATYGAANSIFTSNGTGAAPSWNSTLVVTTVTASGLTQGSVVFAGPSGILSQDNANFFWDDTNNRLGLGTATPLTWFHLVDQSNSGPLLDSYNTTDGNKIAGRRARGSLASPTAVAANDTLLALRAQGWTSAGSFGALVGAININAGESFTSTAQGSYIDFRTTPTGSATIATAFRIGPSGQWGIGGATFGTANNIFKSGGASAAPSWGTVNILDSDSHGDTLTGTVTRGDLIVGNSTPKWSRLAKGSAGAFLRGDGTDTAWSTLILPNAATANRIVYATSANTLGESANLAYDGTDFLLGSGTRARMSGQNRFRYLNSIALATDNTGVSLSDNTVTTIALDSESIDTDTIHDNVTNNSRLTCRLTGKYLVIAILTYGSNATGIRQCRLKQTGTVTAINTQAAVSGFETRVLCATVMNMTATTDYAEVEGYQNSGGSLSLTAGASFLAMLYLGE